MLKWTVSRSLSTVGTTTPHGTSTINKATRRPFRDLSNTPPADPTISRGPGDNTQSAMPSTTTPGHRRPCRNHGGDLRHYFQTTKPNLRSSKRKSISNVPPESPKAESFYQSTPRVDADIGPLTYREVFPRCSIAPTLPTDPTSLQVHPKVFPHATNSELPQNVVNEARVNLQSHISDFFQQISVAGSPEDLMEAGSVPMTKSRLFFRHDSGKSKTPCHPKLAKITKLHTRCRTPFYTKSQSPFQVKQTPLAGGLAGLQIDQDIPKFENIDNTVTEVLGQQESEKFNESLVNEWEIPAQHNDSSVISASQLLEDPSPMQWAFRSPSNDSEGEFTLRRQRGIRRKRHQRDADNSASKRAKTLRGSISPASKSRILQSEGPPIEAVNLHVKKLPLETDIDSPIAEVRKSTRKEEEKGNSWELDSPKSSLVDDFPSCKSSFLNSAPETPEAPLIATVRRCLKYSPDVESSRSSSRGSIEIECNVVGDCIHVQVIRCKDLRRTYDGPIHAYVKASLKNPCGEGAVKRTAVHRATPNPIFHETLVLPCPSDDCTSRATSLDIAVWHRDRRARRSELLGCMTLPLPLAQDKEATWHPLEVDSGRNTSTSYAAFPSECVVSPPLSKDGDHDDNNSIDDLTYLRHLELEPIDPDTGLPANPGFTAKGGRTPCTITRRLIRQNVNQLPWGFSLSWGRPPRVERVDPSSPAERAGLRPGDHVVFVDTTNVVMRAREEILSLIQAATDQLILEVYRRAGGRGSTQRPSQTNVTLQEHSNSHQAIAFNTEIYPSIASDTQPAEELSIRETQYWGTLKTGVSCFFVTLAERRDILSAIDHSILFQNLDELLKLSEEIRDEGGGVESYLKRVPRIIACYRRYLSGLQRACCLLVALRKNPAFVKLTAEPSPPQKSQPDLTGTLLLPLEHYREMTRLLGLASPRNCQQARDLVQGYREATASAGVMEPPRDSGRPLLSLQEVESRLVFARCRPFTLAIPGRQWLFGGALAKVEGRRLQPSWALLLTDLLVFTRVSRDRVLFVTEEPLRLSTIAEACFTVRKRPTEIRLQVSVVPNSRQDEMVDMVQSGGCSPHSRPRRRVLVFRAPNPELKSVWHNLLQRQIIYVNTGFGDPSGFISPEEKFFASGNHVPLRTSSISPQIDASRNSPKPDSNDKFCDDLAGQAGVLKVGTESDHHLVQWVQNSHQIPPDQEQALEEWTIEELNARVPRESTDAQIHEQSEEAVAPSSDAEQHSTASSASMSTVKSNSITTKKNGSLFKDVPSSASINICRRCHRSGCPTPPPPRDPFAPLPPKIAVLPPTPDYCSTTQLKNGPHNSPSHANVNCTAADENNTENGSEDELDCDGEPPYRALRRFGTMSSLDQDDELDDQEDDPKDEESPPTGLRSWTARASNFVVSKMVLLEQLSEGVGGYLLQPPVPPERTEFSLEANDDEGTTSGGTSGDDIWGTPTSGGPDDDSFTSSPSNNNGVTGEDNYGLNLNSENDDLDDSGDGEDCTLPEINMDQLLDNTNLSSLRCFLGRRRLEPLPEEDDSPGGKNEVGWW